MLFDVVVLATAVAYVITSLLLLAFGANLFAFALRVWRRGAVAPPEPTTPLPCGELPTVTVQLPIYNELYVAERIIDAVADFDYPADRLQIQVLDDSTDETSLIAAEAVERARARGLCVDHIRRDDRTGYKAGALAAGMVTATGEFIAIFDADFVPEPDFLVRMMPHFDAADVAFVQARWGHVNREYSWLTRLQALGIDGHFLVEQAGRGQAGYWFNFNGTAGVWRAEAIEDAGGWTADTLTEDLDLSYRAHLRGWNARFVEEVVVPAEIPAQLTGFRRQQHRWARGSLECARRLLPSVWRTKAPFMTRLQASLHLCAYFLHLLLMLLLLMYPLVVIAGREYPRFSTLFGVGVILALSSLAPTVFLIAGSRRNARPWWRDLPKILAITVFGAGLMVNTARAALQIFTRPNPSFERTAKFGLESVEASDSSWTDKRYQLAPDKIVLAEFGLGLYGLFAAWIAWSNQNWGVLTYSLVFAVGLFAVASTTVAYDLALHRSRTQRARALRDERDEIVGRTALQR